MLHNKHITPLLTNSLAILAVFVPPLFSSYLYLQQPPENFTQPVSNITVLEQLGLYSAVPHLYTDAAAGFMKASCKNSAVQDHNVSILILHVQLCTPLALHRSFVSSLGLLGVLPEL